MQTPPAQCPSVTAYDFHLNCWDRGEAITLQVAPFNFRAQQRDAVADWNFYLEQDPTAPRFDIEGDPGAGSVQVTITHVADSPSYCGTFDADHLGWIEIKPWPPRPGVSTDCQQTAHHGS